MLLLQHTKDVTLFRAKHLLHLAKQNFNKYFYSVTRMNNILVHKKQGALHYNNDHHHYQSGQGRSFKDFLPQVRIIEPTLRLKVWNMF